MVICRLPFQVPTLIKPNNIGVFQFINFFSSFWGQVPLAGPLAVALSDPLGLFT